MIQEFYAHGKLLITGEYLVLDGALALAVPTQKGQHLIVRSGHQPGIHWQSKDQNGELWFEAFLNYSDLKIHTEEKTEDPRQRLIQLLQKAQELNPDFLKEENSLEIITRLEFNKNWGLGSSSTVVYMLAKWAQVDAYQLLETTFGGSGYDLACAGSNTAILYQKTKPEPTIYQTHFNPAFREQLFFVYLNTKQNSREAINTYRKQPKQGLEAIKTKISGISETLLKCDDLGSFRALIDAHERIIAQVLTTTPVKQRYFKDYPGSIKSLGGWGGDFILATGNSNDQEYFKAKGYTTIIPFDQMVLN